jgi:hemerythrin-like domain-containing protein
MKSTKLLAADHETILQALHALDAMNADIQQGGDVNSDDIRSLLTFLREFADGCHHVKEEAILFPALIEAGMGIEAGLLRMMNHDHEQGRTLTAAMQNALERKKMADFLKHSRRYVELISEHMDKEDRILFEMAEEIFSDEEDERVAAAFEHFETIIVGTQALERLRLTIAFLASKYVAAAAV